MNKGLYNFWHFHRGESDGYGLLKCLCGTCCLHVRGRRITYMKPFLGPQFSSEGSEPNVVYYPIPVPCTSRSRMPFSSKLNIKTAYPSKISVLFYKAEWCHVPEPSECDSDFRALVKWRSVMQTNKYVVLHKLCAVFNCLAFFLPNTAILRCL
jgi:hypothetical protein